MHRTGPTTTSRRSSRPARMAAISSRSRATRSARRAPSGNSESTSCGLGISLKLRIRRSDVAGAVAVCARFTMVPSWYGHLSDIPGAPE